MVNRSSEVNLSSRGPNSRVIPKKSELGQDGNSSTSTFGDENSHVYHPFGEDAKGVQISRGLEKRVREERLAVLIQHHELVGCDRARHTDHNLSLPAAKKDAQERH
ncbi:hypothetical protein EVAR_26747_1 [Eumeta japonica]|uniref:Uncharacterized protein n=1 Tax=Eumeta variegata TaxID=151549 RepID=A0A4C2A3G5_EUMVA|nr:hypothetical protein EVAR_26747_1 [Eumeta japonica]